MTLRDLRSADLPDGLHDTCVRIAEHLTQLDLDVMAFLPASYFYQKLGDSIEPEQIFPALTLLSNLEHALLKTHGYLQYSSEDLKLLDDEDFFELLNTGELVDPESGDLIENPWRLVHLYYSVRDTAND